MAVDDRVHVGPGAIDLAMDVAFEIGRARFAGHGLGFGVEFHDVGGGDQFRRERARQQEVAGALGMADADVAEAVQHVVFGQHAVGDDEIVDHLLQRAGGRGGGGHGDT